MNTAADDALAQTNKIPDSSAIRTSDNGNMEDVVNETTWCGLYNNNREAFGWALDVVPRGVTIMGNVIFSGTALLILAKKAAGCQTELLEGQTEIPECTNTVYGIRPTSLLTTILTAVGLVSAVLMPVIGAVVDHTKYRRAVGRISALVICIVSFCQIFISEKTWFFISICNVVSAFFYLAHILVAMAYLPELTNDEQVLTKYTGTYTAIQYAGMVLFLIVVVGFREVFKIKDDVGAAALAQSISFIVSLAFFGYSWTRLFKSRPASSRVPEGQYLLSAGFRKLWNTAKTFVRDSKAFKWFLVSLACTEAAVNSFSTVAVTFMSDQLKFTSNQTAVAIFILLVGTVPGALLSTRVAEKYNAVKSLQVALLIWVVNTFTFAIVVKGPQHSKHALSFAFVWGVATGWTYPMERIIYCKIIPKGQEAELMGVYLCTSQIISWLPPLLFTSMNEAGVEMRISFASLCLFFGISFLAQFVVGSDYPNSTDDQDEFNSVSEGVHGDKVEEGEITVSQEHVQKYA